jgi:hypothetical protein
VAQDGYHLAGLDGERHVSHRLDAAEGFGDVLKLN